VKKPLFKGSLIKKNTESFVGINLGNYYIKGSVVKNGKITASFIERNLDLADSLKKLLNDKKIPVRTAKITLKNPCCLVRYFSFPKMDKKKLRQTLFYEINKFIPFSSEEVYFDFFVLKENSPSELFILLAVAKKSYIDTILETFAKSAIKISEINLDSVCLMNLFFANYSDSKTMNACILDMGYSFSTMTILHKGSPFLTRDVKFSTKDIFQVISRIKNVSVSDVEKGFSSSKNSAEYLELAQDNISGLCKEMKSSFDYFEVNKGEHIDKLYLSGGLASLAGIEKTFFESLDIDAEILKVWPQSQELIGPSLSREQLNPFINSFSAAFGLIV
jgi:type IV pilus assembly protein PilM